MIMYPEYSVVFFLRYEIIDGRIISQRIYEIPELIEEFFSMLCCQQLSLALQTGFFLLFYHSLKEITIKIRDFAEGQISQCLTLY